MPNTVTIIQGPAKITWNSLTYFSAGDITVTARERFIDIPTTIHGKAGEVFASVVFEITFQPDGQKPSAWTQFYPYNPSNVGDSIFGNGALTIQTKDGRSIVYEEAGVARMPQLRLSPKQTLFGDMTFFAIGQTDGLATDADFLKTVSAVAYSDAAHTPDDIVTGIYSAAYGLSPYADMSALDGFIVEPTVQLAEVEADDPGMANIYVSSYYCVARFIPANLTEAQVDTMTATQGASATIPGTRLGSATDLVITPDAGVSGPTVTLAKVLPKRIGSVHNVGRHQHQPVEFAPKLVVSAGVATAMLSFA